jgi:hypothetical protein
VAAILIVELVLVPDSSVGDKFGVSYLVGGMSFLVNLFVFAPFPILLLALLRRDRSSP